MSSSAAENALPMAETYSHKIGNVTFQVSSFGNPNATETGQQMILHLLENRILYPKKKGESEND